MSKWVERYERVNRDFLLMADPKYNTKYYIHRLILFLRDHPERAIDYEDIVPDWQTREIPS